MLLSGANSCQLVSTIYKNGPGIITEINAALSTWMEMQQLSTIEEVRTWLKNDTKNSEYFMRSQFLNHFGNFESEI